MVIRMESEADVDAVAELLVDAAFAGGSVELVDGALAFVCETLRAVPDKAEEYWMGDVHRTRIPWTRCVVEFVGITRCQATECDEPPADGTLLAWQRHRGNYVVHVRTPYRLEFQLTMRELSGRFEDVGELLWQR